MKTRLFLMFVLIVASLEASAPSPVTVVALKPGVPNAVVVEAGTTVAIVPPGATYAPPQPLVLTPVERLALLSDRMYDSSRLYYMYAWKKGHREGMNPTYTNNPAYFAGIQEGILVARAQLLRELETMVKEEKGTP